MRRTSMIVAALAAGVGAPAATQAFCGFYVSGAGGEMFNNATQVVLMREGTRTVLSMQNNYQGPPADFAMVVPVPVVLQEGDVRTLPRDVFARVDQMGAPRLVEYWEHDPCAPLPQWEDDFGIMPTSAVMAVDEMDGSSDDYGVKVEAEFVVGEYQVVILSAKDSTGLDRYLVDQGYKIPAGAEPLLRPYVESGSKFFVAKVDPQKVTFEGGMATLSPLRFHYDTDEFSLPIRLGLANSSGTQDLIVNVLAPDQRYEVANYPNVTIPTNLNVRDDVRTRFGEFYAALFDRTLEVNPGAVVTESAWDASTCDPCPGPNLDWNDFATLGSDVLAGGGGGGFVLTRLHARYGKAGVGADLVFRKAAAIVGGREFLVDGGKLEERSRPDEMNNFQGRYAIRHAWTGAIACAKPERGRWGGPPDEVVAARAAGSSAPTGAMAATNLAFAPRGGVALPSLVDQDVPEIGVKAGEPLAVAQVAPSQRGCACQGGGALGGAAGGLVLGGLGLLVLFRRRRSS